MFRPSSNSSFRRLLQSSPRSERDSRKTRTWLPSRTLAQSQQRPRVPFPLRRNLPFSSISLPLINQSHTQPTNQQTFTQEEEDYLSSLLSHQNHTLLLNLSPSIHASVKHHGADDPLSQQLRQEADGGAPLPLPPFIPPEEIQIPNGDTADGAACRRHWRRRVRGCGVRGMRVGWGRQWDGALWQMR